MAGIFRAGISFDAKIGIMRQCGSPRETATGKISKVTKTLEIFIIKLQYL